MKKLLMILALSLPLMAQEVEVKEVDGKTEVTIKKQHDKKDWDRGSMKRGMNKRDKRMAMAKRKKIQKKRAFRSAVRIVVIGGIAYYVGLQQGKKHRKDGKGMKRRMGDKK